MKRSEVAIGGFIVGFAIAGGALYILYNSLLKKKLEIKLNEDEVPPFMVEFFRQKNIFPQRIRIQDIMEGKQAKGWLAKALEIKLV